MLYLFDLDGTLITSYMDAADKNYNLWELLPGRLACIDSLVERGHTVGVVTNQAGVAWGHFTESDVRYKLHQVATALKFDGVIIFDGGVPHRTGRGGLPVWVCYHDQRSPDPRYWIGAHRRKPSGTMIREAGYERVCPLDQILYVGDRPEDEAAAKDAAVQFQWAHAFFAEGQISADSAGS